MEASHFHQISKQRSKADYKGKIVDFKTVEQSWKCVLPIQEPRYPYRGRYAYSLPSLCKNNTGARRMVRVTRWVGALRTYSQSQKLFPLRLKSMPNRLQKLASRFLWLLGKF